MAKATSSPWAKRAAPAAISSGDAGTDRVFTWVLGQAGAASVKQEDGRSHDKAFAAGDTGAVARPILRPKEVARALLFEEP